MDKSALERYFAMNFYNVALQKECTKAFLDKRNLRMAVHSGATFVIPLIALLLIPFFANNSTCIVAICAISSFFSIALSFLQYLPCMRKPKELNAAYNIYIQAETYMFRSWQKYKMGIIEANQLSDEIDVVDTMLIDADETLEKEAYNQSPEQEQKSREKAWERLNQVYEINQKDLLHLIDEFRSHYK